MTSEACAGEGWSVPGGGGGEWGGRRRTIAEPGARGRTRAPSWGRFLPSPPSPASPRPLSGPLLVWSGRLSLPAPSLPSLACRPSPPGLRLLGTGTRSLRTRRRAVIRDAALTLLPAVRRGEQLHRPRKGTQGGAGGVTEGSSDQGVSARHGAA